MASRRLWLACLLTSAAPLAAEQAAGPRVELEVFSAALDTALARVSRPASTAFLPASGDAVRGYHLKGYGAVFVVPARALPPARTRAQQVEAARALDQAVRRLEEALKRIEDADLRRRVQASLTALRESEAELRAGAPPDPLPPQGEDESVALELAPELTAQAEAMRRDSERAQAELDRALAQIERRVRAPDRPQPAPPAPEPPVPPQTLVPPESPPWSLWFEHEDAEARGPERVIHDVRDAVTQVLESHGARLATLSPDEAVVVAVDFVARSGRLMAGFGPGLRRARVDRTLVVRVRKRELEARRDGKIAPEELRKRIEYVEY